MWMADLKWLAHAGFGDRCWESKQLAVGRCKRILGLRAGNRPEKDLTNPGSLRTIATIDEGK
jgi:hypothetical protein